MIKHKAEIEKREGRHEVGELGERRDQAYQNKKIN